jgi:ribose transport system ATP-binding protein
MRRGIRFVHQELSLCGNLRVFENFAVELPTLFGGFGWRRRAGAFARRALDDVFPGNSIPAAAKVSDLSVSQRQMVEIARAVSDPGLRLLILDEPTSSLSNREAGQLREYVRRRRDDGVSFIFISHRLPELLHLADRVVVMQNGRVTFSAGGGIDEADLVERMGGAAAVGEAEPAAGHAGDGLAVRIERLSAGRLRDVSLALHRGEIVGVAGLEGGGQRELLRAVYARRDPVDVTGRVVFISGDRATEGVFPLWSIGRNITLSSLGRLSRFGWLQPERERAVSRDWFDRLQVRAPSPATPVVALSGGNQQKVVIARALAADADVVVLDDPTRGVDLGTKADLYQLFRGLADDGKAVLWYTTDDQEFTTCDRVYVMRDGAVVRELGHTEISPERVIDASFRGQRRTETEQGQSRAALLRSRAAAALPALIPFITFLSIFAASTARNPDIVSGIGITLVFSAAIALAFAAVSQLFVITAGDIDLGLGAFMGLVNVIAATWLVTDPGKALLAFVPLLLAYPLVGLFVHIRRVPAIIVTLGLSFVWLGFASLRLARPGGESPGWLSAALELELPLVPQPVWLCVLPGLFAFGVLMRTRYGAVLRGFGNNPRAVEAAGWSTLRARVVLYALAGLFAFLAGIVVTGTTYGGDPTGSMSFTLLSVAAVILGGAEFSGGVVSPVGVIFATLTLVLVGTMLSLLEVDAVYLPLVQGLLLLAVVSVRTLLVRRRA